MEAEDVTQETFLKIYTHAEGFLTREEQFYDSWAHKILLNTAYTHYKRLQQWWRYASWEEEETALESGLAHAAQSQWERFVELADAKREATALLERTPYEHRVFLQWFYLEGFSCEEIAQYTGLTANAVKVRLFRARQYCQECIKQNGTVEHGAPLTKFDGRVCIKAEGKMDIPVAILTSTPKENIMAVANLDQHLDQTEEVVQIPVGLVDPNPYQPRQHFDETAQAELDQSIKEQGVLQNVTVRRHPTVVGRYQLVFGHRRLRSCERVGRATIPALVREYSDEEIRELVLIENIQRADLTAIEEAHGYQALVELYDGSFVNVAERVGKSEQHVRQRVSFLALPKPVQEMVDEGKLNVTQAVAIVGLCLETEAEIMKIAKKAYQLRLNANQIKGATQSKPKGSGGGGTDRPGIVTLSAASRDLIRAHDSLEKYANDQLLKLTDAKKRVLLREQIKAMRALCEGVLQHLGLGE